MIDNRIIIMFPTEHEAGPFIRKFGNLYRAEICGVGLAQCAATTAKLIAESNPAMIILAGIAGAYPDSGIKKGETVLVIRENSYDLGSGATRGERFRPIGKSGNPADNYYDCNGRLPAIFPKVISNSVNTAGTGFGSTLLEKAKVENMEGAAFFAVCNALGVAFAEIRTISNIVGEPRIEWLIDEAVEKLAVETMKLIENLEI